MNKITVKIQGSEYQMVGDKSTEKMQKIASYVDNEMGSIARSNPKLGLSAIAILTSLNVADVLFECSEENDSLNNEVEELRKNAEKNKGVSEEGLAAISELRESLSEKEREVSELEEKMKELMEIVDSKKKEIIELQGKINDADSEAGKQIKELEERAEAAEKRETDAAAMASEFQNMAYDLQLKYTELKNKQEK